MARSLEEVREPRHLGRLTASVLPDDGVSHPQLVASDPERAALAVRSAADRLGLDPRLPPVRARDPRAKRLARGDSPREIIVSTID